LHVKQHEARELTNMSPVSYTDETEGCIRTRRPPLGRLWSFRTFDLPRHEHVLTLKAPSRLS